MKANASKHKAMSYGRRETEMERLEREIREMSARAQKIDSNEIRTHPNPLVRRAHHG